jgi:anti-anti-sigma regulatory factor
MPGQLVCELERSHPVALIRSRGILDAVSAQELRTALVDALIEQPIAVIVDTHELNLVDEVGMVVLSAVAHESLRWPGARIALAGSGESIAAAARRMGLSAQLDLYPDAASALAETEGWAVPPWARVRLDPTRFAPAQAREELASFCDRWGISTEYEAPALIISELVTNAVVHANTSIDVTLRLVGPLLHLAVRDLGGGRVHLVGIADESSDHGRGLLLVDALAASWGTVVPQFGKVVWATMKVAAPAAEPEQAV